MLNNIKYQFVSIFNSFLSIYLIILLFLFGYSEIVSESYVVISIAIIFSEGFSANIRNIYLGSAETFNLKPLIYNRILIGSIGYIATIIVTYKLIGKSNFLLHSSLTFLIFTNWILQLILARYEKNEKFNTNYIVNLFLFLLISLFFLFYKNIFYLSLLIFFYSITNFLIFRSNFKKISNKSLIYIHWNFGYFSTLVKTIVNFFWKYFIILFVEKTNASFLFMGFAFGSFFSTAFDNSYGALFLKKIKNIFFFINYLFAIYLFFLLIFFFFNRRLRILYKVSV